MSELRAYTDAIHWTQFLIARHTNLPLKLIGIDMPRHERRKFGKRAALLKHEARKNARHPSVAGDQENTP